MRICVRLSLFAHFVLLPFSRQKYNSRVMKIANDYHCNAFGLLCDDSKQFSTNFGDLPVDFCAFESAEQRLNV